MMTSTVFDNRVCTLGEGPLWHPERQQLYWFDILNCQLLTLENGVEKSWTFDEYVSAAAWVDEDILVVASATALYRFDLRSGEKTVLCELEADNDVTRSNDGRADPQGGFWIGTMGINAEDKAGAIYRFYKGELRKLFADITISNSICFSPDGLLAYYCDTTTHKIMKVGLDQDGWPLGTPEVFVDLGEDGFNPDGSVVDAAGNLWNAQWGAHRVVCYSPSGEFLREVKFAAEQISCPAFGGPDLTTLFATSAAAELSGENEGKTFAIKLDDVTGQAEHAVLLD